MTNLMRSNLSLLLVLVTAIFIFTALHQTVYSATINCDEIPATTGPESLEWQEECGDEEEEKTDSINCDEIPATTGPESLEWQEECGAVEKDEDTNSAELKRKLTLMQQLLQLLLQLQALLSR